MLNNVEGSLGLIIGSLGLIIGVIGTLLSIFFFLKSRKNKTISYSIKSFNLLNDEISSIKGFEAKYNEKLLKDLTVSKIHLWNSGTDIINSEDVSNNDRLRLIFPEGIKILNKRIIAFSNKTNLFKVNINEKYNNILDIGFEYLWVKQGCVFSILYTGSITEKSEIKGTIKSGKLINITEKILTEWIESIFENILPMCNVAISIITTYSIMKIFEIPTWNKWTLGVMLVILLMIVQMSIIEKIKALIENKVLGDLNNIFIKEFSSEDFT